MFKQTQVIGSPALNPSPPTTPPGRCYPKDPALNSDRGRLPMNDTSDWARTIESMKQANDTTKECAGGNTQTACNKIASCTWATPPDGQCVPMAAKLKQKFLDNYKPPDVNVNDCDAATTESQCIDIGSTGSGCRWTSWAGPPLNGVGAKVLIPQALNTCRSNKNANGEYIGVKNQLSGDLYGEYCSSLTQPWGKNAEEEPPACTGDKDSAGKSICKWGHDGGKFPKGAIPAGGCKRNLDQYRAQNSDRINYIKKIDKGGGAVYPQFSCIGGGKGIGIAMRPVEQTWSEQLTYATSDLETFLTGTNTSLEPGQGGLSDWDCCSNTARKPENGAWCVDTNYQSYETTAGAKWGENAYDNRCESGRCLVGEGPKSSTVSWPYNLDICQ